MIQTVFVLSNHRGVRLFRSNFSALAKPCLDLINSELAPSNYDKHSTVVYESFISSQEEEVLVQDIMNRMKRRRYEKGHWDAVITNYKEIELASEYLSLESKEVIERVQYQLQKTYFANNDVPQWLPSHAIDLHKEGKLTAHVDSIKFSGHLVAGLSLLSPSIMRLKPDVDAEITNENNNNKEDQETNHSSVSPTNDEGFVDLFLPARSLYVLSGVSRYNYTHELLPSGHKFSSNQRSTDKNIVIQRYTDIIVSRDQRLSVIFRDQKTNE